MMSGLAATVKSGVRFVTSVLKRKKSLRRDAKSDISEVLGSPRVLLLRGSIHDESVPGLQERCPIGDQHEKEPKKLSPNSCSSTSTAASVLTTTRPTTSEASSSRRCQESERAMLMLAQRTRCFVPVVADVKKGTKMSLMAIMRCSCVSTWRPVLSGGNRLHLFSRVAGLVAARRHFCHCVVLLQERHEVVVRGVWFAHILGVAGLPSASPRPR